jgi:hypothetical protein
VVSGLPIPFSLLAASLVASNARSFGLPHCDAVDKP